jgi:hypothetical protein
MVKEVRESVANEIGIKVADMDRLSERARETERFDIDEDTANRHRSLGELEVNLNESLKQAPVMVESKS